VTAPTKTQVLELVERLTTEGLVSMAAIARMLGELRGRRPVHPSTPYRWATKGVRTKDGRVIRLEYITLAGRPVSSRAALLRFLAAQQDTPPASSSVEAPRSPAARNRDSERAAEQYRKLIGDKN
jgi:hypothetical protein